MIENYDERLLSAIIGLARACSNFPKKKTTSEIMLRGLKMLDSGADTSGIIEEIHAEKSMIAPGCAGCSSRCGNTSDYDIEKLRTAPEDIRKRKLRLIELAKELADKPFSDELMGYVCYELFAVSQDWTEEYLDKVLFECEGISAYSQNE